MFTALYIVFAVAAVCSIVVVLLVRGGTDNVDGRGDPNE